MTAADYPTNVASEVISLHSVGLSVRVLFLLWVDCTRTQDKGESQKGIRDRVSTGQGRESAQDKGESQHRTRERFSTGQGIESAQDKGESQHGTRKTVSTG